MPERFSLLGRAWLPVALTNGRRELVRPCEITSEIDGQGIIRIDTGRPDCDIGLTELLIGLLAVATGPKDQRDWLRRYRNPPSRDEWEAAFAPYEAAFVLDCDGPRFFQDFEELDGAPNSIEALLIDAPGGNTLKENADHFVKRGRSSVLSRAGAAIALATLQTSAPSGGAGHRTSIRGGGPLTTLVQPGTKDNSEPTLWHRLWANVPSGFAIGSDRAQHAFPWLVPTRISDKTGQATRPDDVDPAQAFFGMPRRIRLVFEPNTRDRACDLLGVVDDVVVTGYVTRPWGTNYEDWGKRHPLSPYYKVKPADTEYLPMHLQSARLGYRQWLGLVIRADEGLREPARCVSEFYQRAKDLDRAERGGMRLLAAGYAMDNMKPLDFGEALLPLIVTSNDDGNAAIHSTARNWIAAADIVAGQLVNSVRRGLYGDKQKIDRDSTVLGAVRNAFWSDTEQDFYDNLRIAAERIETNLQNLIDIRHQLDQKSGSDWLLALRRHAYRIFDDAVPIDDAESDRIKDIIEGRKALGIMLSGYGKGGKALYETLSQPVPQTRKQKEVAS